MKDNIKNVYLNLEIFCGFFGILYSVVFFFYYFVRINKISAFIFVLPFVLGIYLVYNTKKVIESEQTSA